MNEAEDRAPFAWQPLTPSGVAAFADASLTRLLIVQTCVACMVAAVFVWVLLNTWYPVIDEAVEQLPADGEIRWGKLIYPGQEPFKLAGNRFLSLAVDISHSGEARSPSHFYIEFGGSSVRLYSLLGHIEWPYPRQYIIGLNHTTLSPWWGAWRPAILAILGLGCVLLLLGTWWLLSLIYAVPVRIFSFFSNRDFTVASSWKLAGAALMPGAIFMLVSLFGYRLGFLDLPHMAAATVAHFVLGWVYLAVAPLYGRRRSEAVSPRGNPFAAPNATESEANKP